MNMLAPRTVMRDFEYLNMTTRAKQAVVVVVSDDADMIASLAPVCEFLEVRMEVANSRSDLSGALCDYRPMAVISSVDSDEQDGFHTMKVVARYNRDLPILLLTDGDPVLMGAADAVQDLCGLSAVTQSSGFPMASQLVAFLFSAGRAAGCMRLVPI